MSVEIGLWITSLIAWWSQHLAVVSGLVALVAGMLVAVGRVRRFVEARLADEVVFLRDLPSWDTLPPRSSRGTVEPAPTLPGIVRRTEQAATTIAHLTQELKQTQNRLQYERNRLQSVLSGMGEGVLATDAEGRILLANERAAQLLQQGIPGLVGSLLTDHGLFPPGWHGDPPLPALQSQGWHGGPPLPDAPAAEAPGVEVMERDGRYFRFSVAPIASLEGSDRSGWVVLLLDVTQEKRAEQLKTEFLQTVAHDLRSPLASTMGFVELLSEGLAGELNDLQCEFVGEISSGLHRQLALIDSMLDVSRLESGRVSLNLSSFDLGELVQEVVRAHRLPAQQKEQTLSLGVPPEPLPVVADRLQMERVVTNLLSNAIKYTPLGGRVEVVVERHGAALRVAVKDTGYGISLADQQRLGEKFFRAQNEGLRQVKGTGLGLAITKTILAQHGSALQVESELGQGSTFSFTLAGAAGSA